MMRALHFFLLLSPLFAKAESYDIFKEVTKIYQPVAKSLNQKFEIIINDHPHAESASAETDGVNLKVVMSKKLLNKKNLSPDGSRIILCHEIGHLYGGSPRKSIPFEWIGPIADDGFSFSSSEGQADFYAATTCFRKLIEGQDHKKILKKLNVNSKVAALCESTWKPNSTESEICQRTILAAENFLKLNGDFKISVDTPDQKRASKLLRNEYPSRQCRLDTFVKGSLCKSLTNLHFDFYESQNNECVEVAGQRPVCWYLQN